MGRMTPFGQVHSKKAGSNLGKGEKRIIKKGNGDWNAFLVRKREGKGSSSYLLKKKMREGKTRLAT